MSNFLFNKSGPITTITFNRPEKRNCIDDVVLLELESLVQRVRDAPETRVLVTTGSGNSFCAGADLSGSRAISDPEERARVARESAARFPRLVGRVADLIAHLDILTIAAINGYAIGGGLELALSCDIIIASENAKFGQSELNVGAIPGVGGTQRLPRLVGLKRAKEMIFTGDLIDAQEALRIGLVNKVVKQAELLVTVESLVDKISQKSPLILRLAKEALNRSSAGLGDGLNFESSLFAFCFSTKDQKEGATAFLEKRKPIFTGE